MLRIIVMAVIMMVTMTFCARGQCQTVDEITLKATATSAIAETNTVVTGIDKEALLKELRLNPTRQEASERGWAITNTDAKRGDVFQLTIAVCGSRKVAQIMEGHEVMLISAPSYAIATEQFTVGDLSLIGKSWAFFVRDNVFVTIGWKDAFPDRQLLARIDKFLVTSSPSVSRGQFEVIPKLKDVPDTASVSAGQTKDICITWEGMGKASPTVWVSSPGSMSNRASDATVQLKVSPDARGDRYPVTICATSDRLVFATATIDVTVTPAQTQPSTASRPADTNSSSSPIESTPQ